MNAKQREFRTRGPSRTAAPPHGMWLTSDSGHCDGLALVVREAFAFGLGNPPSGSFVHVMARLQMRRQLFLCVEHPPLHRPDWDGLSGGDLVVFPLLDEAQFHDFA